MLFSTRHCSIITLASNSVSKITPSSGSSRWFPLNDSMYPLSHGDPDSMNSVFTSTRSNQSFTQVAVNSGPLSDRMSSGTPRRMNRSDRCSKTSSRVSLREPRLVREMVKLATQYGRYGYRRIPELRKYHIQRGGKGSANQLAEFTPTRLRGRLQKWIQAWAEESKLTYVSHHTLRKTALQWSREEQIRKAENFFAELSNVGLDVATKHYTNDPARLRA